MDCVNPDMQTWPMARHRLWRPPYCRSGVVEKTGGVVAKTGRVDPLIIMLHPLETPMERAAMNN
ncbi:hypothetical protein DDI_1547 [Dickeya dianthicola RNS04.9]|nr:hypothetical protein DDI_1547 [Dickeya dianthicola RNS04.9]